MATASSITDATGIQLGIRANLNPFLLLILLNAFVGGMVAGYFAIGAQPSVSSPDWQEVRTARLS